MMRFAPNLSGRAARAFRPTCICASSRSFFWAPCAWNAILCHVSIIDLLSICRPVLSVSVCGSQLSLVNSIDRCAARCASCTSQGTLFGSPCESVSFRLCQLCLFVSIHPSRNWTSTFLDQDADQISFDKQNTRQP